MPLDTAIEIASQSPLGPYLSVTPAIVSAPNGDVVARLHVAPAPYVSRAITMLRRAEALPASERIDALARTAAIFRDDAIDGLTLDDYIHVVSAASGIAIDVVRTAAEHVARACESAYERATAAMPRGATDRVDDPRLEEGAALWTPRGSVFGVLAAGNHPSVNTHWLEAVALGYRVAVRPSRREPFTASRLVSALLRAGFVNQLAFLPTDHEAVDTLKRSVDLMLVYGGDDVINTYANDPKVFPQGPGRSKVAVGAGAPLERAAEVIVDSALRGGGAGCTNATGILVEGDVRSLASAVAERLAAVAPRTQLEAGAILPVYPLEAAERMQQHFRATAKGADIILGEGGIVHDLGDGSAALTPAVVVLNAATDERIGHELPFPCLWFAPWARADGWAPTAGTLALSIIDYENELFQSAVSESQATNVYLNQPTWWSRPGVPHDGYLGAFLMNSRAVHA